MNLKISKLSDTRGAITGKFSPRAYDLIRSMPDQRRFKDGVLYFKLSGSNLEFIVDNFKDIASIDEEIFLLAKEVQDLRQKEQELIKLKQNKNLEEDKDFPFVYPPYDHQLKAFSLGKDRKAFGLLFEMGCGKTKTLIDQAAYLYMKGEIDFLLILAPNGVHRQWILEQIPEHMPKVVNYEACVYRSGMNKKEKARLNDVLNSEDKFRIVAMNIEALSHKSGFDIATKLLVHCKNSMVAIDESSRIKNNSKRTKNCIRLSEITKYKRILTGTPVTNGVEDLFYQLNFLDKNIFGLSSFTAFKNKYCVQTLMEVGKGQNKRSFYKVISYQNLEDLQQKLDGHTYRVRKEDCLDLPDKVFMDYMVELTDEQKKHFKILKENFILELETGEIKTVALAITRLLRLHQIIIGYLPKGDDSSEITPLKTNRPQVLLDMLNDIEGKTIVWCRYIADFVAIKKILKENGIGFVHYTGTQEERTKAIDEFRNNSNIKVFIANPKTAGIGLNLTCATTAIWYSYDSDLESYLQANDRIHRIGQKEKVTYIHLVSPTFVENKILNSLKDKKNLAETVVDIRDILEKEEV